MNYRKLHLLQMLNDLCPQLALAVIEFVVANFPGNILDVHVI